MVRVSSVNAMVMTVSVAVVRRSRAADVGRWSGWESGPGGVSLWFSSSRDRGWGLVEGAVAEHGVEDVAAASGEGDEGFVVLLSLGDLAVVVGAGDGVSGLPLCSRTVAPR